MTPERAALARLAVRGLAFLEAGECPHGLPEPTWCSVCLHGVDEEHLSVSRKPGRGRGFPPPRPEREPPWGRLGYDPRHTSRWPYPG